MRFLVVGSGPRGGDAFIDAARNREGVIIIERSESLWDWSFEFEGTKEDKEFLRSLKKEDLKINEYIDYILDRQYVPLVEEIERFPAKEESTGASPVRHTEEDAMIYNDATIDPPVEKVLTTFDKLRILEKDTELSLLCEDFEELHTFSKDVQIQMIHHRVWEADVTFYVHSEGGVLRQDATFRDGDFEAVVEKVWKAHQKLHSIRDT